MVQGKKEEVLVRIWLAENVLDGLVNCGKHAGQYLGSGWGSETRRRTAVNRIGIFVRDLDAELLQWNPISTVLFSSKATGRSLSKGSGYGW